MRREQRELEEGAGFDEAWTSKYRRMKLVGALPPCSTLLIPSLILYQLLRRFRDLVEETVLDDPANGDGPDCPICYTTMTTENASRYPLRSLLRTTTPSMLIPFAVRLASTFIIQLA